MIASVTPDAGATLPGRADADGWRRLHPLSPLLRGGIVLIVLIGIVVSNLRDRFVTVFFVDRVIPGEDPSDQGGDVVQLIEQLVERGLLLLVLGAIVIVIVIAVAGFWVVWRFSTYRITDDAVEARHGVLFRTHRRAPLERIQSVNLQRSLIARILGLTKIEVLTGGQGGKVELSYLGFADAKMVREQIILLAAAKRSGTTTAAAASQATEGDSEGTLAVASLSQQLSDRVTGFMDEDVDEGAIQAGELVRVPVGRLIASIALGWESVVFVLLAILAVIGAISGAVQLFLTDQPGAAGVWAAVLFACFPMMFVCLMIMITQFNKGFRFSLSRSADSVRTSAGLTATATETIPFGRVHAVEARQPLLWRPLGWWRVRITLAGHSVSQAGQNGSQNVVLPVGSEADVLRVFETLLPTASRTTHAEEDITVAERERAAHDAELLNGLSGQGLGYQGPGRRAVWVLLWGKMRAGITVADIGTAEATLRIRRGVLTRSFSVMPIVRAQSVLYRRPFVQRFLGLATVHAHTVLGPVRMEMRGLDANVARETFNGLAAEMLRVQGNESRERRAQR